MERSGMKGLRRWRGKGDWDGRMLSILHNDSKGPSTFHDVYQSCNMPGMIAWLTEPMRWLSLPLKVPWGKIPRWPAQLKMGPWDRGDPGIMSLRCSKKFWKGLSASLSHATLGSISGIPSHFTLNVRNLLKHPCDHGHLNKALNHTAAALGSGTILSVSHQPSSSCSQTLEWKCNSSL